MADSGADSVAEKGRNLSARRAAFGRPFEFVESEIPVPGSGEVVIRVLYCGICGSELHILKDPRESDPPQREHTGLPSQILQNPYSVAASNLGFLGHEYSGVVESAGPDVSGWEKGARVVGLARLPCGSCSRCLAEDPLNCLDQWRPHDRAYAKYMLVRAAQLRRVPDGLDLRLAALATPFSECLHSLDAAEWRPGLNALVVGAGPMGLCTTVLLLHSGAVSVVVTEPNEGRRNLAASLGAVAVPPEAGLETVAQLSTGEGVDVAFESVGSVQAFTTAMSAVRQGGRVVMIGLAPRRDVYELELRNFWNRRISIVVGGAPEPTIDRALNLMPHLGTERLIAGEFPLDQMNEAFASAANGWPGKVLVTPWAGQNPHESSMSEETGFTTNHASHSRK